RTAQTLSGYVAGLIDTSHGTRVPNALVAQPTDVRITTDPATNQAFATVVLRGTSAGNLTLQLGGGSNKFGPTSAFIDNNTYAMTSNGRSTRQIGDHSFRAQDSSVLASANSAPVQLPGMGSCTCDYLKWGWFSTKAGDTAVNLGTYVAGTL